MADKKQALIARVAGLEVSTFEITSNETEEYNCIAWAAHDTERWWWPGSGVYWPPGVREEETVDAFEEAYATLGYERCDNGDLEEGFEKIAIYERGRVPTHAARQLPNGTWTSKLGALEDVEHPIDDLRVVIYGNPVRYMKRKRVQGHSRPVGL